MKNWKKIINAQALIKVNVVTNIPPLIKKEEVYLIEI